VIASGLHGVVMRGPTAPVCRVGVPCSAPAKGATLEFDRHGRRVARVHVGAHGIYSIRLAPGDYTVLVVPRAPIGRGLEPAKVHVSRGASRRLDFSIDTGIR
jgi:hypothetical protein